MLMPSRAARCVVPGIVLLLLGLALGFEDSGSAASSSERVTGIYSIGLNGKGVKVLSSSPGGDLLPSQSHDGKRIAFVRVPEMRNQPPTVWVMNADGSNERLLFASSSHEPAVPSRNDPAMLQDWAEQLEWSPDGKSLALTACRIGDCNFPDVLVLKTSSGELWRVVRDARNPSWSRDGSRIVHDANIKWPDEYALTVRVSSIRDGQYRGASFDRKGRGWGSPRWSPVSRKIVFVDRGSLYRANPDFRSPRRLIRGFLPFWSPEGKRIGFLRFERSVYKIFTIGSSGGRVRFLATGTSPSWSPQGNQVAYAVGGALWVVSADGMRRRRVTSGLPGCLPSSVFWSRNGRRLIFACY
jgi:Tol biopolymer transport system component